MTKIVGRLLAFAALALLTACGNGGGGGGAANVDDVVVADEVRVLDAAAREALDAFSLDLDSGAGELRFAADSAFAAGVETGAILAAEPVPGVAEHGLLQRVKAKRSEGGQIVLETEQATLEETFERASIDFDQPLLPSEGVEIRTLYEGVAVRQSTELSPQASTGFDFNLTFDEVLIDDEHGRLELDGSFHFDATASANIDIDWFTLERFSTKIAIEESADVSLSGSYSHSFGPGPIEVATFDFGTFTIWVGPVPVVFVLDMVVSVGAEGEIEASLLATAKQTTTLAVGAKYTDGGGWEPIEEFDSDFDWDAEISAQAAARAYLRPQVNLQIYGLAGPYAYADAYVKADAAYYRTPFWTLSAGLDFGVGFLVELPVVGEVARLEPDTWNVFETTLDASTNEPPTLEVFRTDGTPFANGATFPDGSWIGFDVVAADREQQEVAVELRRADGTRVDASTAIEGAPVRLRTEPEETCVGSYTFEVLVDDGHGGTDSRSYAVSVHNRVPEVRLPSDLLDGVPIYPGAWVVVHAEEVGDVTCGVVGNAADEFLIDWYVNGARVAQGREFFFQVDDQPQLTVQAAYDDGIDVGWSSLATFDVAEKPEGVDLPPTAIISDPEDGYQYTFMAVCGDGIDIPLVGYGIDSEDGPVADLVWETRRQGASSYHQIGTGREAVLNLCDVYGGDHATRAGYHEIRLTTTDDAGQTDSTFVTIYAQPPG